MSVIAFHLNKPYPLSSSIATRWRNCALFSTFVFLFLYLFKPFEISSLSTTLFAVALGYALVCFLVMALLNVALFSALPNYFSEDKWNVKRELFWALLNILLIGIANFFYSVSIGIANFSLLNLYWFELYTLAIGVFPVTATILVNHARLNTKYENESQIINPLIDDYKKDIRSQESTPITFVSENGTKELELLSDDFLFAKSDDNYVELFYLENGKQSRKVVRNTLKNISTCLPDHHHFLRCHKSYIVHLKQVRHISGNAQGYKLHVNGTDELVSVSRTKNDVIKHYFTDRH